MPSKTINPAARGKVLKGYDTIGRPIWHTPVDLLDKLMSNVQRLDNGCWEWTGWLNKPGYGALAANGKRYYAHRLSYTLHVGSIPEDLQLDHVCHSQDNTCPGGSTCLHRRCVNPGHLEPVSPQENSRRGVWAKRTHCPQGHPYDETNTARRSNRPNKRECRTCNNEREQAKRAARTHCERGHELTSDNLIIRKGGARCCRVCREALAEAERGAQNSGAKLTEDDVRSIRARSAAGESQSSIARSFGLTQGGVSHVVCRTTWGHIA